MNRRDFITQAALGMGGMGLMGAFAKTKDGGLMELELPNQFREIDHNQITHKIRDGFAFPMPQPESHFDTIICGGGISGLTCAYSLGEANCLVLEKEPVFGGNSRRLFANGIFYPLGAVVSQGAVEPFTQFFKEIGISFDLIPDPDLTYLIQGKRVTDPFGKGAKELPFSAEVKDAFSKFPSKLAKWRDLETGLNYPKSESAHETNKLNEITLAEYLGEEKWPSELLQVVDLILQSRLGVGHQSVCAWEGLYILSRYFTPKFTLPGGHGAVSEKLYEKLSTRKNVKLMGNQTVVRVSKRSESEAWVAVWDESEKKTRCFSAKTVVMATPKLITKYVIEGLPEAKQKAFATYRYTPFLVAQVFLDKPLSQCYELVVPDAFAPFYVRPDFIASNRSATGHSHLTVYSPLTTPDGRQRLLNTPPIEFARKIDADLHRIFGKESRHILGMHLHRWGHPMMNPLPGLSHSIRDAAKPFGNIFFAHSDSFGISGLYSAVWTGMETYSDVQLQLQG